MEQQLLGSSCHQLLPQPGTYKPANVLMQAWKILICARQDCAVWNTHVVFPEHLDNLQVCKRHTSCMLNALGAIWPMSYKRLCFPTGWTWSLKRSSTVLCSAQTSMLLRVSQASRPRLWCHPARYHSLVPERQYGQSCSLTSQSCLLISHVSSSESAGVKPLVLKALGWAS